MNIYDQLLVGIGLSLIASLATTTIVGPVGVLPIALIGVPLVGLALFVASPVSLIEK